MAEIIQVWRPIDEAPQDGRPVWVRGLDFGKGPHHFCWAYFMAGKWWSAETAPSELLYLNSYMPDATNPSRTPRSGN